MAPSGNRSDRDGAPTYLVIGHVTRDVVAGGGYTPGGTACYSALYAERLGARVAVLTSASEFPTVFDQHPAIEVCCHLSEWSTTFENIYENGHRRQFVRGVAGSLGIDQVPAAWRESAIVHLGPLVQEVDPRMVDAFPTSLVGVTPQGWLRAWREDGLVSAVRWESAERVLARADVVILSMEDLGDDREELERLRCLARLLVLTDGRHGATVYDGSRVTRVPAFDVQEVDPTGAGDVFAAAFFVRLHETQDPVEAARFANCEASFLVEAQGTSRVPTREQVEERLRFGRLRA